VQVARREGADLEELLQAISRKELAAVCEGLMHQVRLGADLLAAEPSAEAPAAREEGEPSAEAEAGSEVLLAAAMVARMALSEAGDAPPDALLAAAAGLHDAGLLAAADFPALQEEVARLCVDWWTAELPGRDRLTPQTVPYLLVAALQSGSGAAVRRCHATRAALGLFDFDDPSIGDLKRLLLRAAFAPCFLRASEGRRFLASLFTLQPAFVRELAAIVRNQVPAGRRSVLEAYGEVVYRAWAGATGACLLEVQHTLIQGLVESAVLASTPAVAAALRRGLGGLHAQKHQPGVDAALLALYEPILFRRLNAANADVRCNALNLLVDAFPLRVRRRASRPDTRPCCHCIACERHPCFRAFVLRRAPAACVPPPPPRHAQP
jgi:condensin-2 complex subunit G2